MKEKLDWINALKTIGILSVILGHFNSPLSNFIFSWHMPLFFIISGFFINLNSDFKALLKKNFNRLLVPYFIFSISALIVESLKRYVLHRVSLSYLNELVGIFFKMDMQSLQNHYGFVLWFLPTLFFAQFTLRLLSKISTKSIFLLPTTLLFFFLSFYIKLPFAIDISFNVLFWIYFGNIYFKNQTHDKYMLLLPIILIAILIYYHIPHLNISTKSYENQLLNIVWAISINGTAILIFKKLKYLVKISKLLSEWGQNTMLIFIIHPYTNNIAHLIIEKIGFGSWPLKFFISISLLQFILYMRLKNKNWRIFNYV